MVHTNGGFVFHVYNDIDEILPRLYLGNQKASRQKDTLRERNIESVLCIGTGLTTYFPDDFEYKHISIDDDASENILEHFESCIDFIERSLNENRAVFVHCAAGVSRSASVVIAYVMRSRKLDFSQAYDFVKSKRPAIFPNDGFRHQLRLFHEMGCKMDHTNEQYISMLMEQQKKRAARNRVLSLTWKL